MNRFGLSLFALLALLSAGPVAAQADYPDRPVRIIVGFPPGGPADTLARLLAERLAAALGKPFVVDNVTGAAGSIALERVSKAAPDGHTLALAVEAQVVINPSLHRLSYDPAKDFAPISELAVAPYVLVVSSTIAAKSVSELVALARQQAGELTFGSAGGGSSPHMAGELFRSVAGVDLRHVPYKGIAPAISDLLGGRITMVFSPLVNALPAVRDGRLRALGITSVKRFGGLADVPTLAEAGYPGFEMAGWLGLFAPAGTAAPVVRTLQAESTKALSLPALREKLASFGVQPIGGSPEAFAALIREGGPKWAKLVRESGAQAD